MFIRVYNYNTMDKVKAFEAHTDYIRQAYNQGSAYGGSTACQAALPPKFSLVALLMHLTL